MKSFQSIPARSIGIAFERLLSNVIGGGAALDVYSLRALVIVWEKKPAQNFENELHLTESKVSVKMETVAQQNLQETVFNLSALNVSSNSRNLSTYWDSHRISPFSVLVGEPLDIRRSQNKYFSVAWSFC